ncbi:hypothetical protein UVI_02046050 [Ustilaginoidea virens]|uniref:YCII-related domain-containing protein n=1 Tax=Ustilaginoidea virens TaxID=1159556 RepID=A0A1B5L5S4_USTVR|nr:hypothetical protein UVI_02046050 [Ustilaginoidea virens]
MASAPSTREFLVIIPDKPGATAKRLQVRPFPEGDDPATFDFMGSTVVFRAETKEQVLELLKQDVYSASGVWDIEKKPVLGYNAVMNKQRQNAPTLQRRKTTEH